VALRAATLSRCVSSRQVLVSGTVRRSGDKMAVERAAPRAYLEAGVGPEDLDVIELREAATPAELIVYEELGLCESSRAPALLRSGDLENDATAATFAILACA